MSRIKEDDKARENREIFQRYAEARRDWDVEARDAIDFTLGNHYTAEESEVLQSVGQADFTIDRIYAAIDKLKSLMTSRPVKFGVTAREDSDTKLANVWRTLLEYIYDISDGQHHFKQAVHDYATAGIGYFYAYVEPEADYGRGEVMFTHVNPFRVYVDPASRDRYFKDAANILMSTILTKEQLLDLYPDVEEFLPNIETHNMSDYYDDYPDSQQKNSQNVFTPSEVEDKDYENTITQRYRIIERFSKVRVPYYRVADQQNNTETIMSAEAFQIFMAENEAQFNNNTYAFVEIPQTRIKVTASLGQVLLYETILDTDTYPIVPIPNIWTNTPYPKSDVNKVKDMQRLLNKLFSLALSHAQTSAGLKLLVPQGSVESISQLEKDWANPNAVIEYDPSYGEPHFPSPQPLTSQFYALINQVERYIDLNFGVPELLQGFKEGAPQSVRGTMLLAQMGEGRGASKLRDIEMALQQLGKVLYQMSKEHYTFEKKFRIVQPNNDITQFAINNRMYDDKTKELVKIENDITSGQFDVRVVSGSTMPNNKHAEYQMYLEAYQLGLIDRTEALKKTEIFDKEGVLQRTGEVQRMQGIISQLQDQIKLLSGDLQTAQRESMSDRKRVEVQKFKSELNKVVTGAKAQQKVNTERTKRQEKQQVQAGINSLLSEDIGEQ
jgi:hypothetical protein|tara:strand:+ start:1144 stop:3144 length:2001 start_codon:yes stop_codon:yes gene_type:complete